MTKIKYSSQQKAVINAGLSGKNLIVQAYAGCSKSTTLEHLAKHMSHSGFKSKSKLMVAFNVRAKKELELKMGSEYSDWQIKTFNGLGHSVLMQNGNLFRSPVTGNLDLQALKMERLTERLMTTMKTSGKLLSASSVSIMSRNQKGVALGSAFPDCIETYDFLLAAVNLCKIWGIKPYAFRYEDFAARDTSEDSVLSQLFDSIPYHEFIPTKNVDTIVNSLLNASLQQAKAEGIIDFADQIYLSVLYCPNKGRQYQVILGDEIQDASLLNNAQIERASPKNGQVVLVGDEYQSIYQFRGAMPENMNLMKEAWKADPLVLGVTFRCPTLVVEKASKLIEVDDFKAFEKNKQGNVQEPFFTYVDQSKETVGWRPQDIIKSHLKALEKNPNHKTVVLSSKNEGCFAFLAAMLASGSLLGKKFGLDNIGWSANRINSGNSRHRSAAQTLIENYLAFLVTTVKSDGSLTLDTLADALHEPNPDKPNNSFVISTVHRYKGLEADHVYLYDPDQFSAMKNLFYVAITRTKNKLSFLKPDMYAGGATAGIEAYVENVFGVVQSTKGLQSAAIELVMPPAYETKEGFEATAEHTRQIKSVYSFLRAKSRKFKGKVGSMWNILKMAKSAVK